MGLNNIYNTSVCIYAVRYTFNNDVLDHRVPSFIYVCHYNFGSVLYGKTSFLLCQ